MKTDQIAAFTRRSHELYRRLMEGALPVEATLAGLQKLVEGDFGSKVVDLDATPFIPEGWTILPEDQIKSALKGQLDAAKIIGYFSEKQKGDKRPMELEGRPVINANGLDFFLKKENQYLIPESWKDKKVFFWGTIYRLPDGSLCVRCLYWDIGEQCWDEAWLGFELDSAVPFLA